MIITYPTRTVIQNYELGSSPKLEKALSVWDKNIFSYTFSAFLYDEDTRELIIPAGFNIAELVKLFPRDEFVNKTTEVDKFNETNFSLKFPVRDDLQHEAIRFLLHTESPQKFFCLPTGKGKTYCSINYVFKSKKMPIVLVDQENLMEQWKKSILGFTTITEDEIFMIKGKDSIQKLLKMTKKELTSYKWFIAIHRTISNYIESDMSKIDVLFKKLGIGVKIYDEAHVEYQNIFHIDALTNSESIYVTATPSRSDPVEDRVYKKIFHSVPIFKVDDEFLERYHNVIIVKYNSKPSANDQIKMSGKYGFDVNKWCDYILSEDKYENFYNIITTLLNKSNKTRDKKTALLFHTMKGNAQLQKDLVETYSDLEIGRFDSSIKDKIKRAKEWEKDLVVTTDMSFGKAIDVKDLMVVLDTVPFGSKVMSEQMLGRLREIEGKEVFYIAMVDVGFKSCINQLKQRKTVYNKKAKKIYEIDLTKQK